MRAIRLGFLVLILLAALPLIGLAASSTIAEMAGCRFNENDIQPCTAFGLDLGTVLAAMVMFGWLNPLAVQLLALVVLLWVLTEFIGLAWGTQSRSSHEDARSVDETDLIAVGRRRQQSLESRDTHENTSSAGADPAAD